MRNRTDETISLRGFYLRLLSRWYLLPLVVAAGALIGGLCYYCAHVVFAPAREYAAGARLYLEFSPEAAPDAQDYYNAWTWKELITGDEILDAAMDALIDAGYADEGERTNAGVAADGSAVKTEDDELVLVPGKVQTGRVTRAEVLEAVTVRLPSDLRVMMLTVTRHDADTADAILAAMTKALAAFGERNPNFLEIRVLEETPALPVVTTDRTKNAVIFGAVLGLLLGLMAWALYCATDDALYDPEQCARRFGRPVLGVLPADGQGGKGRRSAQEGDLADRFARELTAACGKRFGDLLRDAAAASSELTLGVLAADAAADESARVCAALQETLGVRFLDGACRFLPLAAPIATGQETPSADASRGALDAAILCAPYGRRGSAYADHALAVLAAQDIDVAGVILYDADTGYLKKLYRLK